MQILVKIYDATGFPRGDALNVEITDSQSIRGLALAQQFNTSVTLSQLIIGLYVRVEKLEQNIKGK